MERLPQQSDLRNEEGQFDICENTGFVNSINKPEKSDIGNVSFNITELIMHNNIKIGYWVAVSGLIYDISNFINQYRDDDNVLIQKSGTDITIDYQIIHSLNPEFHARLSTYFIGKLIDPFKDNILNEIKNLLYACIRIENSINIVTNYQNSDLYRPCIQDTQEKMMSLLDGLYSYLNQIENEIFVKVKYEFKLFNEIVDELINDGNTSLEDFLHILYRYKGLCYIIKYTLEKALISPNLEYTFDNNFSFLIQTIEKSTNELINTDKHIVRNHYITIIGGSLCGVVLAIYLKKKFAFNVHVYDKLDDPRIKYTEHSSASFNITLSIRGLMALSEIGLKDSVQKICIPVYGRCFHTSENELLDQLYGPHNEALYAVKRDELLHLLVSEAEKEGIVLHYGVECHTIKYSDGPTIIHAVDKLSKRSIEIHTNYLFGADGLNSKVRETIDRQLSFEKNSEILKHKMIYREFVLPANEAGEYMFRNDRLHIWPRDEFIILAFPNAGGSFTLTLCIPDDHQKTEKLKSDPQFLNHFLKEYFPDISPFIQRLILNEPQRRWGTFDQVNVHQWYIEDKVLILGDAAHAFYPFYGQAANSAFEDCRYLVQLIEKNPNDWNTIFSQFQCRKQDTDTIANLTTSHGKCLTAKVNSQELLFKTKISLEITRQNQRIQPLYNNISFTDLPYRLAPQLSRTHEEIFEEVTKCLEFRYEHLDDQMIISTVVDVISRNKMTLLKDISSEGKERG